MKSADNKEVIGWENIELISDRPLETMLAEFKQLKAEFPDRVLIASIMEEYSQASWDELIERCEDAGVDAFEINFRCGAVGGGVQGCGGLGPFKQQAPASRCLRRRGGATARPPCPLTPHPRPPTHPPPLRQLPARYARAAHGDGDGARLRHPGGGVWVDQRQVHQASVGQDDAQHHRHYRARAHLAAGWVRGRGGHQHPHER